MKKAVYEPKFIPIQIFSDTGLSSIPHFHKEVELVYIKKGACDAYIDRKHIPLKVGDCFINFPNQIHYYENSVLGEYYVLIINPNVFFKLEETLNGFIPENNKINLKNHSYIAELLESLFSTDGKFKNTIIAGILNQFIGFLLPEIRLNPRIKIENNSTLQSVLTFCADNFTENINLDTVAKNLYMSKYHISHLLTQKLGINFNTYLNMLRVDKACDLLENTNKKAADISEEVGFGSIRSFNRAFSQITNMTPLKYRNQFRTKNNV